MLIIIAAFVGSIPVNASQSIVAVTTVGDIPDVTSNANQPAALCDAGQAATSDTNEGFISVDVSEHASSSGCPISGDASQLNDVNVQSDFPLDFDYSMSY